MVLIPASCASRGLAKETRSPAKKISPSSGQWTPVTTLIKVDFPAPFSPTSACTSPVPSPKETSSSARTPGNLLVTPRTSRMLSCSLISPPLVRRPDILLRVALVEKVVLHEDPLGNGLTGEELLRGVEGERAEAWVGLDRGAELALDDGLKRIPLSVDRDHGHVLARSEPAVCERLDGAYGHLVVLGVDGGQLGVGADNLLCHGLPVGAGEVAGLGDDHLHTGASLQPLPEAIPPVCGDRGPERALQLDYFGLSMRGLRQPLGRPLALPNEVGAHKGYILLADLGVGLAVNEEDGHVGLPG